MWLSCRLQKASINTRESPAESIATPLNRPQHPDVNLSFKRFCLAVCLLVELLSEVVDVSRLPARARRHGTKKIR